MNTEELHRAYGDSHTLDRPTEGEAGNQYHAEPAEERFNPLDHPDVVEDADSQGWGN